MGSGMPIPTSLDINTHTTTPSFNSPHTTITMAAVAVSRPALRRESESNPTKTSATPAAWRPLADALMSANAEESINLYSWSETSSVTTDTGAEVEINITVAESEYAESEVEDTQLYDDNDPDNIYDALTCDYDIVLTPGTATPSPCVTPIRTPREDPLHAHIAAAAITNRLSSRVEPEQKEESYAFERIRACCVSCVHGLQALTNALLGEEPKEIIDEELIEVPHRPGAQVHFLVHRSKVEPECDEIYELGEDFGEYEDME